MFLDKIKNANEFEIFSFEPNPALAKYHPVKPSIFINRAVWTENITRPFFVHGLGGGSTLLPAKSEHNDKKATARPEEFDKGESIDVICIDLCEWISTQFDVGDYIILKLDIEGAEYPILDKMVKSHTIAYINKLYCEFHAGRCGVPGPEHNRIITEISKYVKIREWNAMKRPYLIEPNCAEFRT